MIQREARTKIQEMAGKFAVIALVGPRQSGKTTLAKNLFQEYDYVSLENPDRLEFALSDPYGFLEAYGPKTIIDEAQNAPTLFSYIQQIVDESSDTAQYILSGSQNFLLLEKISQSLAGRVYIAELLPLSQTEIQTVQKQELYPSILYGGYPRIYDKEIHPSDYFPSYIQTYLERDVRTIINVHDLGKFRQFVTVCATYTGQQVNANTISKEVGIDAKTVKKWLSILETSYIAFTLKPWFKNFKKRLTKSPKLYFYDTGLVCNLLGLDNAESIQNSSLKGPLFENYILTEILKCHHNHGKSKNFYFWRDSNGNEIDLIIERGLNVQCVEMKAGLTVTKNHIKALHYLDNLEHKLSIRHYLINATDGIEKRTNETILGWNHVNKIG